MSKEFEGRKFSLKAYKRAQAKQTCICSHFGPDRQPRAPYNRSCPYHGEHGEKKEEQQ